MFGLSSGPEKYQKVISDALNNCVGVANIADNIIVYGKRQKEHNGPLDTVMCMQNVCGLTLNKKPCQFCLSKLTFFGHEFSTRGIDASEEISQLYSSSEAAAECAKGKVVYGPCPVF